MNFELHLSKRSQKFLANIHPRYAKQLKAKLLNLKTEPYPHDSKQLIGYAYYRTDAGEYRIIYRVEEQSIYIELIGKRNDDEVYKKFKQLTLK